MSLRSVPCPAGHTFCPAAATGRPQQGQQGSSFLQVPVGERSLRWAGWGRRRGWFPGQGGADCGKELLWWVSQQLSSPPTTARSRGGPQGPRAGGQQGPLEMDTHRGEACEWHV